MKHVILLLTMLFSGIALATPEELGKKLQAQYVQGGLEWIHENTRYTLHDSIYEKAPQITVIPDSVYDIIINKTSLATYERAGNNLYMRESHAKTPDVEFTIIHELVHYVQIHADLDYGCVGEMEMEAYLLESEYAMRVKGFYNLSEIQIRNLFFRNQCDSVRDRSFDKSKTF